MARDNQRDIQRVKDTTGKITKANKYIVKTDESRRNLDAINGTVQELAVFVATLVSDLKKQGVLK